MDGTACKKKAQIDWRTKCHERDYEKASFTMRKMPYQQTKGHILKDP